MGELSVGWGELNACGYFLSSEAQSRASLETQPVHILACKHRISVVLVQTFLDKAHIKQVNDCGMQFLHSASSRSLPQG